MKLTEEWYKFTGQVEVLTGQAEQLKKRVRNEDNPIEVMDEGIRWFDAVRAFLEESFEGTEQWINFRNKFPKTPTGIQGEMMNGGAKGKHRQEAQDVFDIGIKYLIYLQYLLSVQDVTTGSIDQDGIEARKELDTQGKEDLLLEKLYELDNDEDHLLQPILEGNGVPLKSEKEVRELAEDLSDEGFIDYPATKDAPRAQINAKGRKRVEELNYFRLKPKELVSSEDD